MNCNMATLTEVGFYTRRIIKWGAMGLVVVMLIPPLWKLAKRIYLTINPPPPPAPTVRYGKLPKLAFPEADSNYKPTYRLETIEGGLPKLANVSRVYFVTINKSRILELEKIKPKARTLEFEQDPEKIDEANYKFTNPNLPTELAVNIIYNSYRYTYDWRSDPGILDEKGVPNNEQALLEAKSLWQNLGLLADDLANGRAKVTFLSGATGELIPTISLSGANFVRVDLFRADKDELKVVSPKGEESPVYVILSGSNDRSKRIVEASYSYSRILDNDFSTYPLKGVDKAWAELQAGSGYIAHAGAAQAVVRKASLAYYESGTPQEFLQPVYVFEGDGGFVGYVPAVNQEYSQ
ncbi:MAG: hypothetical protein UX80_C0004G0033 [Candidatus Amesbacteria bacterium GW2011_GWA2_47_11b]|uniref:Uncharacterized protein n=3 Tax=Candidatus Amesiibacteriota TaxID=1752730 RepID=A0A0G1VFX4_9BACT|nr:MAG: hypothetical protein UX80_C0004G0033 [Candidatus Amesbacteria bacterium GW2011_GWA2_47_11b]KKU68920.1 MAG: hypothetical protein UX92_C0017G0027 [Candidatus Amesbacteria bacterium GW2011_GWA1_47_20]